MKEIKLVSEVSGVRLDKFLSDNIPDKTRSALSQLIESGMVFVNGKPGSKSTKVSLGDEIDATIPDPVADRAEPENIPLDIVYEDDALLVVNKPKGMVVHPAAGNHTGTLVNALLYHAGDSLSGIGGVKRPGIVHRIDKDTSGLLMVAKTDRAHVFLADQIKVHSFLREYEAIIRGKLKADSGEINAPIGRHPIKRKQMAVTNRNSKEAVTFYEVIERYPGFTHVRLRLKTGRTHQIRAHMAYIGHPVAGDELYGGGKIPKCSGQCLHAKKLGFIHPNGEYMEFDSPLPDYFETFLAERRKDC